MKSKSELVAEIKKNSMPCHIAIIMDGNGRWAKSKNLPRVKGHYEGTRAVKRIVKVSGEIGLDYLTIYAFSTENWKRPNNEPKAVLTLIENTLMKEIRELYESNVVIKFIGSRDGISKSLAQKMDNAYELTKNNTGLHLFVAVNYGGRLEIVEGINALLKEKKNSITLEDFPNYLYTKGVPDPDLLIRTSGEMRISNYLIWQIAYSEMYFTKTLWPDFSQEEFLQAIIDFQTRARRFGGV
ncbi:MAG TPA: isoprenyl transferase [Candidatus Cloacimonetes bacterium]|nr:isoprenyl transferase [Candidatus Cloacimonadota bacterium]HHE40128.1 isoprenyl transferase [Candidatus Cloacimonadota bacterium]